MCLIVFDWQPNAAVPLKVAANRDEVYARPALPLHRWPDAMIIGGRDGERGGTWLAAAPGGRFAALTNVREPAGLAPLSPPSRGELVRAALESDDLETWLQTLRHGAAEAYAGFNLLALRAGTLWHLHHGRRGTRLSRVEPGCHALSNATLDTPWPKVAQALSTARRASGERVATTNGVDEAVAVEGWHAAMRTALQNPRIAADAMLPATGVDPALERFLSPAFIRGKHYGTRALTLAAVRISGETTLEETSFGPWGRIARESVTLTTAAV
ncbi:NRDE family protein [Salinicola halophilus]|uniref:NRDE family protein n=1 Tax=Salinicola halophilus TaxID=184065 RepID=UPI000DA183CF|nr:NRDE family protein [Salinicola halophilus]